MKIKLLSPAVVDGELCEAGTVVDMPAREGGRAVARGIAEAVDDDAPEAQTEAKGRSKATKAPAETR